MVQRRSTADEQLRVALGRVAPGMPLRDGIDRVVRAKAGALLVLSDDPEVLAICTGGFLVDAPYSPQRLSELAKMDGAIIISTDGGRSARANVHLVPDPTVPTSETGTCSLRKALRNGSCRSCPLLLIVAPMKVATLKAAPHTAANAHNV